MGEVIKVKYHAWQKQERRLARQGVPRQPQSGGGLRKGDNRGAAFLVSCKTTAAQQFTLKMRDLSKMTKDAHTEDRMPLMQLEFSRPSGMRRYALLEWDDFEDILAQAGISV